MVTLTLINLNKDFACGEVLTETDLDLLVWFINLIIDYLNGTVNDFINSGGTPGRDGKDGNDGRDGSDGNDGHSPEITIGLNGNWYIDGVDTGVSATHESGFNYDLSKDLTFINLLNLVNELKNRLDNLAINLGSGSSYDLNQIVEAVLDALNEWDWGEVINNSYFDEIIKAYITQIGLVSLDSFENGVLKTTYQLSQIVLRLTSIELTVSLMNIGTDEQGNQINILTLTASVVTELRNNYGYALLLAALNDWPSTITVDGTTINNPTIFSALSKTINSVEKNEAGLLALYLQYAGVISLDAYTASLIEGLANELMAKTTVSSAFGEYFTAQDGLPVYDTWDDGVSGGDGSPVYETDAYGRAIPYTGIVLRYIRYEDENHLVINDPDAAEYTKIVSDPTQASYAVKKVVRTDNNGNPEKDLLGNILYDLVILKDNQGNDLRKQLAFKVYYRSNVIDNYYDSNDPPDSRTYSYGRYGQFAGNEYYYFEEDFNGLFTAENGQAYDYSLNPLYMSNLQRYDSTDEANNPTVPYIKSGEIKWGTSTPGDYNDGHYGSNGLLIGVVFIKNYGPDKIAYHKVRKMKIKSSSGIITTANMDSAFATVFAQQGLMYSAIVNMTTSNSAFISAVASAAANLTDTALATAKMIADASMYLARTLYKYHTGSYDGGGNPIYSWYDIATAEEEFLGNSNNFSGNPFSIDSSTLLGSYNSTAERDLNNNIITRIKSGISGEEVEWVQDTTYVYNGEMHTFEQFKKDKTNGVSMNNLSRKNLWIRNSDGVIIKAGDIDETTNKTYTENSYSNSTEILITTVATPKKKLITQATSGIINTVDLADDYALALLFAKIESDAVGSVLGVLSNYVTLASISAVVRRKLVNGNPVQASEVRVENNNNVTYYLYRNKSLSPITVDGTSYQSGGLFWIDVPYTLLENDSNYSSIFSNVEPIYELESNITLTADLINLIAQKGEVYINNLVSDNAFILTLSTNILLAGSITANSVLVTENNYSGQETFDIITRDFSGNITSKTSTTWNVTGSYNININNTDGIKFVYTKHFEDVSDSSHTSDNSSAPVIWLKRDGTGLLANGNIQWNYYFDKPFGNSYVLETEISIKGRLDIYLPIVEGGSITKYFHMKFTPEEGMSLYLSNASNGTKTIINQINTDGSGSFAHGNISWNVNGDTIFKGIIYNSLIESLSSAITIDGTDYHYMLNENVMDPDVGFYLAIAYKENSSDSWEYFGGKDYSGTDTDYTNLISMDGSGFLAKGNICWDKDGNTTFKGTVNGTMKVSSFYQQYLNLSGSGDGNSLGVINLDISKGTYIIAQVADSNYYYTDNTLGLCASIIIIPDPNNAPNVTLTIVAPTADNLHNTWVYPVIRAASGTFFYTKKDYSNNNNGYYRLLSFMLVPNLVVKLHSIGGGWYLDTEEDYITSYSTSS